MKDSLGTFSKLNRSAVHPPELPSEKVNNIELIITNLTGINIHMINGINPKMIAGVIAIKMYLFLFIGFNG